MKVLEDLPFSWVQPLILSWRIFNTSLPEASALLVLRTSWYCGKHWCDTLFYDAWILVKRLTSGRSKQLVCLISLNSIASWTVRSGACPISIQNSSAHDNRNATNQARNQRGEPPLQNLSSLEKCAGHSLKNLGPSENPLPRLVSQAGYRPATGPN